jgi:hypothetical protein
VRGEIVLLSPELLPMRLLALFLQQSRPISIVEDVRGTEHFPYVGLMDILVFRHRTPAMFRLRFLYRVR